jgi:hypothetical protein
MIRAIISLTPSSNLQLMASNSPHQARVSRRRLLSGFEELGGSQSLRRAAVLAMRDAAALIIMQMERATKISQLANGPLQPEPTESDATLADTKQESEAPASVIGIFAIGGIDDAAE